jgi:hypothetical protein
MGEACSELEDDEKWVQNVGWKGRDHSKDLGRREDDIKMCLREIDLEGVDLFHVAQDSDCWPTLVNTVVIILIQ